MDKFSLQFPLEGELVSLIPLKADDFDALFQVASDPLIWEQHPNKERYILDVFTGFFEGAMLSNGAYLVRDAMTGEVIGTSRYYDKNENDHSVFIGYTFIARKYWGKGINTEMKKLMLDHAFQYCNKVFFHVGINNIRSQKAMERIGGVKVRELEVSYYNEASRHNFEYVIMRESFVKV